MDYSGLAEIYEKLESTQSKLKKAQIIADFLPSIPSDLLDEVILMLQGIVYEAYSDMELGVADKMMIKAISKASGLRGGEVVKLPPPPPGEESEIDEPPVKPLAAEPPPTQPPQDKTRVPRPVPTTGKVQITCTFNDGLSWAWVDIDGLRKAATPLTVELSVGKHEIRLSRPGYKDVTRQVTVRGGVTTPVKVELEAK